MNEFLPVYTRLLGHVFGLIELGVHAEQKLKIREKTVESKAAAKEQMRKIV